MQNLYRAESNHKSKCVIAMAGSDLKYASCLTTVFLSFEVSNFRSIVYFKLHIPRF